MKLPIDEEYVTERLILQRLKYEDAEEIFYAYASKLEATWYMSWPTHERMDDTHEFLRYAVSGWKLGIDYSFGLRLKGSNRFVGSCGMMNDEGRIQFGYVLSPTQWGKGYATEVCRKMMAIAKSCHEVYRVGTFIDAENVASARVLLKSGLVEEARLAQWFRFINQENLPKDCILFRLPL